VSTFQKIHTDASAGDMFGRSTAFVGDVNGDSFPDMAVGAPYDEEGAAGGKRGAAWVIFLNQDGSYQSSSKISWNNGGLGGANMADDAHFGASLAELGDLNNDGVPDLMAGACGDDTAYNKCVVYTLFLTASGTVTSFQKIPAPENYDKFGGTDIVNLGDLDGDSVVDVAVGAYYDSFQTGSVWILFLNVDGTAKGSVKIHQAATNNGLCDDDWFGSRYLRSLPPSSI
jgi:hypothetical protein